MSEERKIYVPVRGTHVKPPPYEFTPRWFAERGKPITPDRKWRIGKYSFTVLWTGGTGFYIDRKMRSLRCWRLYVCWKRNT